MGRMEDIFCLCLSSSCVCCNNIGCHSLCTCGFALQSKPAVQVHLNLTEVKVDSSQDVCVRQKGSRETVLLQQDAECGGLSSTSRPISNNLSSLYIGTIPPSLLGALCSHLKVHSPSQANHSHHANPPPNSYWTQISVELCRGVACVLKIFPALNSLILAGRFQRQTILIAAFPSGRPLYTTGSMSLRSRRYYCELQPCFSCVCQGQNKFHSRNVSLCV